MGNYTTPFYMDVITCPCLNADAGFANFSVVERALEFFFHQYTKAE